VRLLLQHHIRVPQLLYTEPTDGKYQMVLLVEEFIQGKSLKAGELLPEHVCSLALQMARLHSVTNPSWGPVAAPRNDDFFASQSRRISRGLVQLQKVTLLTTEQTSRLDHWFANARKALRELSVYSLTHNDLHPANGIYQDDSSYVLLDVDKLEWAPAAREVVEVHRRLLRNDPDKVAAFDQVYDSAVAPEVAGPARQLYTLYEGYYLLNLATKLTAKMDRPREEGRPHLERAEAAVAELLELLRHPAGVASAARPGNS
jgi:Ser/Thr protein kinase RdoA (MazF antagonist)